MRLLVTEDDPVLGAFLRKGLAIEGYQVDLVLSGEACLGQLELHAFDLLLLDLTLPDIDGEEVLKRMEGLAPKPCTVVLTGRTQLEERIRCLDLGADDFLVKPFSFGELTARCRAVLRSRKQKVEPALRVGDLTLSRLKRSVTLSGVPVDLTPKEFALLEMLMLRRGACCSREELLQRLWPGTPESGGNVLDVYINYLRRKLATAAERAGLVRGFGSQARSSGIETVRGSGYRVIAPQVPAVHSSLPVVDSPRRIPEPGGVPR